MSSSKNHLKVYHDLLSNFFYIKVKGGTAELRYERHGDDYIDFYSTNVPEESRHFGVGGQLVEEGLAFAKEQQLKVKPSCPFVKSYIEEHSEYQDLLY